MANLANFLTVLRVLITPAFMMAMVKSKRNPFYRFVAAGLFGFGAVTDWLDGQVARRTDSVSEFGKTADPLADRVFIGASLITLYRMGILPLPFLSVVLGRDVLMAAAYPVISKVDKSKVAVHWTGKISTAVLFVAIGCLILTRPVETDTPGEFEYPGSRVSFEGYDFKAFGTWQTVGLWLFGFGMFWSVVSAGVYAQRVIALLREQRDAQDGQLPPTDCADGAL